MPGVKKLRRIQFGKEATPGTAVPATRIWRGVGALEDLRELKFPEEDIGLLGGSDRSYIPSIQAALSMDDIEASYEQLPVLLTAGVAALTTGVADGSGSDFVYTYNIATNAQPTITTFTLEGGDDQQEEEAEYCFVDSFKLSGKSQEAVMMSAEWIGRQITSSSFTGSLALTTVDTILFQQATLAIDTAGGTYGATPVSNSLLAFDLEVKTGIMPYWTANGNKYFTAHKGVGQEITLKLTFEHDANVNLEKVAQRAETPRLIRLKVTGPAVTTAGTTYSNKTLIIDLPGKWTMFEPLDDQDGDDTVTGEFHSAYNATVGNAGKFIVVHELSTIA